MHTQASKRNGINSLYFNVSSYRCSINLSFECVDVWRYVHKPNIQFFYGSRPCGSHTSLHALARTVKIPHLPLFTDARPCATSLKIASVWLLK